VPGRLTEIWPQIGVIIGLAPLNDAVFTFVRIGGVQKHRVWQNYAAIAKILRILGMQLPWTSFEERRERLEQHLQKR
jgi:hypothetical protein